MELKLSRTRPSREAIEEASQWLVEFRAGDVDARGREQFIDWLRRSPDNIQSYLEVAATWAELPTSDPEHRIDLKSYLARARADQRVTQLKPPGTSPPTPRRALSRLWWGVAAAFSLAAAIVIWSVHADETYVTRIGEQRTLELPDGSSVELNAHSRLRVHMTGQQREMQLIDGQALFHVAKDPTRPFIVNTGNARIRAVGTQFDVYRQLDRTTVTVIEGKVAVSSAKQPAMDAFLVANQQLTLLAQADMPRKPVPTDSAKATAWLQKRLVFEETPLSKVAEEFNRYNTRCLIIEGDALRDIRISGIYSSTDPTSLIEFLRNYPDIRVTETTRAIHVERIH